MKPCVCGHAEFLHGPGCLRWFLDCGCAQFEADDGKQSPGSVHANPSSDPYTGIYAKGGYRL